MKTPKFILYFVAFNHKIYGTTSLGEILAFAKFMGLEAEIQHRINTTDHIPNIEKFP